MPSVGEDVKDSYTFVAGRILNRSMPTVSQETCTKNVQLGTFRVVGSQSLLKRRQKNK